MHSRRRRIVAPSREDRESITLSSWQPHLGHRISAQPLLIVVAGLVPHQIWGSQAPRVDFPGQPQNGRKSVLEPGDDEVQVHEYLENCRRTPMHHGERTPSEPEIRIRTPGNEVTHSRRRTSSATEVPGCQLDTLKPLCCGCRMTIILPLAMPSLTAPVARAGPAGVSP
jgi:hypothetical protein